MWQDYFTLVKLHPGEVQTFKHGLIDFKNPRIPVALCKQLFDEGFPYLELTKKGRNKYFPETKTKPEVEPEVADDEPEG